MKKTLFLILIFFLSASANCQDASSPFIAGLRIHSGLNLPFYKAIGYLVEDGIYAIDINVQRQAIGNHIHDARWNYPFTGWGYSMWNLGNNDVFGKAHVLYGNILVPLSNPRSIYSFGLKASAGGAYLTKSFDIKNNHLNRAIGSHLNIYMNLSVDMNLEILAKWKLSIDAGLTHFSNGKTRSPNYGINAATISVGLIYNFIPGNLHAETPDIPPVPGKYLHTVSISGGPKVYDDLSGKKYLSTSLSYGIERHLTLSGKAGLGTDLFYDSSIGKGLKEQGMTSSSFREFVRFGVHASYALQFRNTRAGIQAGYYLYSKYTVLTKLYTRLSIDYFLTDRLSAGLSIRSHFGKADSFEYGIGYTW